MISLDTTLLEKYSEWLSLHNYSPLTSKRSVACAKRVIQEYPNLNFPKEIIEIRSALVNNRCLSKTYHNELTQYITRFIEFMEHEFK